jgi:hypothetical protein
VFRPRSIDPAEGSDDDVGVTYRYRAEVLEALGRHGLSPRSGTAPRFLRDAINGLYRYEIRRLKRRLLAKEFPKDEYVPRVIGLRGKYLLLSMPMEEWTE